MVMEKYNKEKRLKNKGKTNYKSNWKKKLEVIKTIIDFCLKTVQTWLARRSKYQFYMSVVS